MERRSKKLNRTKTNYLVDFAVFIAFLIAMDPRSTGIAIHEWLSIAFGAAIIVHLLLNWEWIDAVTRRFFRKVVGEARINYVLNALLFIDGTIAGFTGLMISKVALPLLGIRFPGNSFWVRLHSLSADAAVFLLGLHVALHWKWIVSTTKRYVLRPLMPARAGQTQKEMEA